MTTNIKDYSTTQASNTSLNTISVAEGMLPSNLNNAIRALMKNTRDWFNDSQWVEYGDGDASVTYAYASGTSFTIAGVDVTSVYHAGRRIKLTAATPGTIYGTISSSSFSTNPNITNNNCRYTKVGNLVTVNAYVAWGTDGAGGSGNLYMGGLPFTQNNSQIYAGVYFGWYSLQAFNEDEIFAGYINSNQSYIVLECLETDGAGRSSRNLQAAAANGTSGSVQINCSYTV